MAVTVGSWASIDDTEIDAESPITESLMVRNRDNSYWIDAGTRKTTQTSQTKVLVPDGSGGVEWVEVATLSAINGSSSIDNDTGVSGPIASLTIPANVVTVLGRCKVYSDLATDENVIISYSYKVSSGVLTYDSTLINAAPTATTFQMYQNTLTGTYQTLSTVSTNAIQAKIDSSVLYFKLVSTDTDDIVGVSGTFF